MDNDKRSDLIQAAQSEIWVDKVNTARVDGRMAAWATFLCGRRCRIQGGFMNGSYNLCQTFVSDDATWILRLARGGTVHPEYADEKVAVEVEMLTLLRERTTMPVPRVHAWGLAAENPLELGPYILMDFVEGVPAHQCLRDPGDPTRLLREDISESDIELLYRQLAGFQLQLFSLNFDRIGSLPTPKTGLSLPQRPLTWKSHDMLRGAGVNAFGDRQQAFSSTTEYFKCVVEQDRKQLAEQLNSVAGPNHARNNYKAFNALETVASQMVNDEFDRGPFKLICDDLGLANLILKSKDDFTVVGVVDLEWSYIGPAQLAASAPWWLVVDRPVNPEWDCIDGELPEASARYLKHLELYKRVLREEEVKLLGPESTVFSELVQWSQDSGAMWLHMLLSSASNDTQTLPFEQLRRHVGTDKWKALQAAVDDEEAEAFAKLKVLHLEQYDAEVGAIEKDRELVDGGRLAKEQFIARNLRLLSQGFNGGNVGGEVALN